MYTSNSHNSQENIECPFLNPKMYIYSDDGRKSFEAYQEGLAKETEIIEVWRWYSREFFHFKFDVYINAIEKFLPDDVEEFAKHCNTLRAPTILQEIFAYVKRVQGDDILIDFMYKAPICTKLNEKDEWDCESFAAPTMMDFLFNVLLSRNPINKEIDEEEIKDFSQKLGKTLLNRDDGYFLVWNYVKYLLSGDIKNQDVTYLFIEKIGQVCSPILKEYYGEKDWLKTLRPKGFKLNENREKFSQTGLLGITGKPSMYLNILTQMQFYNKEKLNDYIPCFEDSILLEDEMFKAFSTRPLLCHYYISDIYLASENPIEAWRKIWHKMSPAYHRIWFNRYDEFSIRIERNINFLLIVGVAMMEQLYQNEHKENLRKGAKLCNILLDILMDMINRDSNKPSQLCQEMFDYLVTWQFVFNKKEKDIAIASEKTTEFILNNNWHPRHMLEVLLILKANGFNPNLQIENENANDFHNKIMWATDYAIEQEKSEYKLAALGREIKNWVNKRSKAAYNRNDVRQKRNNPSTLE